jgi:hypothetical protein
MVESGGGVFLIIETLLGGRQWSKSKTMKNLNSGLHAIPI